MEETNKRVEQLTDTQLPWKAYLLLFSWKRRLYSRMTTPILSPSATLSWTISSVLWQSLPTAGADELYHPMFLSSHVIVPNIWCAFFCKTLLLTKFHYLQDWKFIMSTILMVRASFQLSRYMLEMFFSRNVPLASL